MERLGLNKPLYAQYLDYIGKLAQGDLGESLRTRTSVWTEFTALFPATLELSMAALLFAGILGLLAGVIAALKRGSLFDHGVMGISLAGYSMPIFWWGLILIMFFSVSLGWTPVSGRIDLLYDIEPRTGFMLIDTLLANEPDAFWDALHHLILPAIVLGTIPLAVNCADDPFVDARSVARRLHPHRQGQRPVAGARGVHPWPAECADPGAHRGRPASRHPAGWCGIDRNHLLVARHRQMADRSHWRAGLPGGANGILLIACLVILVNFVVDILYGFVNPRIRHQR